MIKTSKHGDKVLNLQSVSEFNHTTGIQVLNKVPVVNDKTGVNKASVVVKDKDKDKADVVKDKPTNVVKDKADVVKAPVAKDKDKVDDMVDLQITCDVPQIILLHVERCLAEAFEVRIRHNDIVRQVECACIDDV
ncbi:hypothetical protein Tco_0600297 [Tanacetum coccineum]|uniref:Uncharacterized protein n=1 Tax=Tanacetum coccineum TaxID=301880 RepID=A0ABQ4WBC8_9ASTR